MSSSRDLDSAQAREIEEQLFSVHRQQLPRQVPIPLPRQDFWEMIRKLLSSLDLDIQEMMRNGSIDMRLQNLQKRQTNIRRIASELARKRMVAMMQHAASQSLRSAVNPGMTQELPALDWQRNDPAEKAFYSSLENQVDRFKKEIDWMGMQQGIAGEVGVRTTTHAPGTMQLDAFVKEGMLRKNLNIPLPLMLLNHENSFLKKMIVGEQTGGSKKKNKKNKDEVISDSLFDKLIDLKSKTNLKKTRKHKRGGGKRRKKTKKLFIF